MTPSRRGFLRLAAAASAGALASGALEALFARAARAAGDAGGEASDAALREAERRWRATGYGPLARDPDGLLDLPAGFRYRAFSTAKLDTTEDARFSDKLTNGDWVPARHDGMGSFAGPDGVTILVRNHEVDLDGSPGVDAARTRAYDPIAHGGTTTLWVDAERNLVRSFASLSGTVRNCAGGVTPWGSWLTCEECTYMPGESDPVVHDRTPKVSKRHGYVFEVDSRAESLVEPAPILAMGRFYHEACTVDPATGFVYMSEDRADGCFYRYRPLVVTSGSKKPDQISTGDLAKGGTLEALRIVGHPQARTQNWIEPHGYRIGQRHRVDWVPVPNIDPDVDMERDPRSEEPDPLKRPGRAAATSVRAQAFAAGAAQFARIEGVTQAHGALYACATMGGESGAGQVWKLDFAAQELSLIVEPNERSLLDGPDNLTVAPNGDLFLCEDGEAEDRVVGVTPHGKLYPFARNAHNDVEFAGACFSPDGRTMFFNIQDPGITFAVWGPWETRKG
jgi:secreted PhoX family phosphatase